MSLPGTRGHWGCQKQSLVLPGDRRHLHSLRQAAQATCPLGGCSGWPLAPLPTLAPSWPKCPDLSQAPQALGSKAGAGVTHPHPFLVCLEADDSRVRNNPTVSSPPATPPLPPLHSQKVWALSQREEPESKQGPENLL